MFVVTCVIVFQRKAECFHLKNEHWSWTLNNEVGASFLNWEVGYTTHLGNLYNIRSVLYFLSKLYKKSVMSSCFEQGVVYISRNINLFIAQFRQPLRHSIIFIMISN